MRIQKDRLHKGLVAGRNGSRCRKLAGHIVNHAQEAGVGESREEVKREKEGERRESGKKGEEEGNGQREREGEEKRKEGETGRVEKARGRE